MGVFDIVDGRVALDLSILSRLNVGKNVTLVLKSVDASASLRKDGIFLVSETETEIELTAEDTPVTDTVRDFAEITAAQVKIESDITVRFYTELSSTYAEAQMRFTVNGKEMTAEGSRFGGGYVFDLAGISFGSMNDTITAELIFGDRVLTKIEGYSVAQNFRNLLAKSPSQLGTTEKKGIALKGLLSELLENGISEQAINAYKIKESIR